MDFGRTFVILNPDGHELSFIKKGDRITQAAIGKMAGLDPNTVSQIIRGLEQKELITREKSSDGRAKNPILTGSGGHVGYLKHNYPTCPPNPVCSNFFCLS